MKLCHLLTVGVICGLACLTTIQAQEPKTQRTVNALIDISHAYDFFSDWSFPGMYFGKQNRATNMAALYQIDLKNVNLIALMGSQSKVPYTDSDISTLSIFVQNGGGLAVFDQFKNPGFEKLAKSFQIKNGGTIKSGEVFPTETMKSFITNCPDSISAPGAAWFELGTASPSPKFANGLTWKPLLTDKAGNVAMWLGKSEKGHILLSSRAFVGKKENQAINQEWMSELFVKCATGKPLNTAEPFSGNTYQKSGYTFTDSATGIVYYYSDYLKPYFQLMHKIETECRPMIEKRMGVPLSGHNASEICLLATGGGGFSSGKLVALAVFWENFPDYRPGMVEFITHESVHSWVLPFAEIWNEPIATYVGDLVVCDMGYPEEGMKRINHLISGMKKLDPTLSKYDIHANANTPDVPELKGGDRRTMSWGKTFFIFEELRKQYPDIVARYFKAKRQYADPAKIKKYELAETITVMSYAVGKDLFPWFATYGLKAEKSASRISVPEKFSQDTP